MEIWQIAVAVAAFGIPLASAWALGQIFRRNAEEFIRSKGIEPKDFDIT